ncbi:MAG: sugar transferase [bacterium]|nr:sugar transferase [bacterium]
MGTSAALGSDGGNQTVDLGATELQGLYRRKGRRGARQSGHALRVVGQFLTGLPVAAWMLLDVAILSAGLKIGYANFVPPAYVPDLNLDMVSAAAIYSMALALCGLVFGLYERETLMARSRILTRVLLTTATATVLAYAAVYLVMYTLLSRRAAVCGVATYLVLGTSLRVFTCWAIHKVKRGLLLIGPRSLSESFVHTAREGFFSEYELIGHVDDANGNAPVIPGCPKLGGLPDVVKLCRERRISDIVVGTEIGRQGSDAQWMLPCLRMGCRVTNEAVFYEKATGQILVDEITPSWFLFADLQLHCDEWATLKRASDLLLSALGLILSAPFWPIAALCIRLDDGGPVLHSQDRVGQNGSIFRLYKFRTMRVGAENGKSIWATANDPRVTRVGRLLRRSRLDELPQLYNIFMGEMSIVGPRPERPDLVVGLTEELSYYSARHLVKPGLTGWAQISFRYGNTIEDAKRKLQFDLYYLKHMCWELDIIILLRTVGTFLRGAC